MGIKGMLGTLVGTVLGTETINIIGKADFGRADFLKGPTQTFTALGVLGNAAKTARKNIRIK